MNEGLSEMGNDMNKLQQGLSVVHAIWAVVMIVVSVGVAIGNEHLRVTQNEWETKALKEAWTRETTADEQWRGRVDSLLLDIRERLARMESK